MLLWKPQTPTSGLMNSADTLGSPAAKSYGLPTLAELQPAALQNRIMSKAQWDSLKRFYRDLEAARARFEEAVKARKSALKVECQNATTEAHERGLNLAAEALIKNGITTTRTAREQQDELVQLVFGALDTIVGTLPSELVSAKLVRKALDQQIDANSVIGVVVHPNVVDSVRQHIETWRDEVSAPRVEITTNSAMTPTDCDIETLYGTVRAGLEGQLSVLRNNLLRAEESAANE